MTAYYNEHDPFAAAWLRELIADNLIAPGEVDERSIEDVTPDDLRPFRQCHFFAGIGVWSLAARRAGWDDDTPLWTGSCPCQPFSAAGKGEGFDDERHLWPAFHYLIEQCRPALVVGEQVAGKDGDAWFDLVSADLDATGYGFGAAETCAAGFGAPHKRNRNYWVALQLADGERPRLVGFGGDGDDRRQSGRDGAQPARSASAGGASLELAYDDESGRGARPGSDGHGTTGRHAGDDGRGAAGSMGNAGDEGGRTVAAIRRREGAELARGGAAYLLADAEHDDRRTDEPVGRSHRGTADGGRGGAGFVADSVGVGRSSGRHADAGHDGHQFGAGHNSRAIRIERPGPVNGLWADADWLRCRDEKWRPVGPGSFPLADAGTVRNRVGLLRGAGNAVTLAQAEEFLVAVRRSI